MSNSYRYKPFSKQEFYTDVLAAMDDASLKSQAQVVNSLLRGKYSWENLKDHYTGYLEFWPDRGWCDGYRRYLDDWKGCGMDAHTDLTPSERSVWRTSESYNHRPDRWVPAMQNKVAGALRAMKNRGVFVPSKARSCQEVDFSALRVSK